MAVEEDAAEPCVAAVEQIDKGKAHFDVVVVPDTVAMTRMSLSPLPKMFQRVVEHEEDASCQRTVAGN